MYRDVNFTLKKDQFSDISVLENELSVKQSVSNILLTNKGELHFFPQFGCDIRKYLFEKINPFTILAIKDEITFALRNFEPRVRIISIDVYEEENRNNSVVVDLVYYINVLKQEVSQQLVLRLL